MVQVGPLGDSNGHEVNEVVGAMVEVFNKQFSSVFTAEDTANIPSPENIFQGGKTGRLEDAAAVKSRLERLREDKSPGVDDLSPRLWRAISEEIACPVATLFKQSTNEGDVPLDRRSANVAPVFKKGNRNQPENYRASALPANSQRSWNQ